MKFLIMQSAGHHNGNDGWTRNDYLRECFAIKYAIEQNNHSADIYGLRHANFEQKINLYEYDIILCIENYEFDWIPNLSSYKGKKIYWTIDLHCQPISNYYEICKNYDIILHSTKSLIPSLEKILPDKHHLWFPNGVDSRYFTNKNIDKNIDVAFVGSKNESRKSFIEQLEKDVNLKYFFATGEDMINLISASKIHFNKNISCDINYRTFETIGLGTCLITDYNSELLSLGFEDNVNCLMYKSYEEALFKIKNTLLNENWKKIAQEGIKLSINNTYIKRVEKLLIEIGVK